LNTSSFGGSICASSGSTAFGSVLGSGGGSMTGGVVSGGSSLGTGGFSGGGTVGRATGVRKSFEHPRPGDRALTVSDRREERHSVASTFEMRGTGAEPIPACGSVRFHFLPRAGQTPLSLT
jgi:hypothetical protein